MPFRLWGATGSIHIALPDQWLSIVLLLLYTGLFGYLIYYLRQQWQPLQQQRPLWLGLCGAALLCSQLFSFAITSNDQLAPLSAAQNPVTALNLLAVAPFLLAAAILNPLGALSVGAFTGLGRSFGQTHQVFDIYHFALAAYLAALCLRQNYAGRLFGWLRQPIITGALITATVSLLVGVATFATADARVSRLAGLDLALSTMSANFWLLLLEGIFGGIIVMIVFVGLPQIRPVYQLVPSPLQRSLRTNLLSNFVLFAVVLIVLLVTVVFRLSVAVSTQLVVNQMAHDANAVTEDIPQFQSNLQNLLTQYSSDTNLLEATNNEEQAKDLGQLYRNSPFYRRILLVDETQAITSFYPTDVEAVSLTEPELTAVLQALENRTQSIAPAQTIAGEQVLSFVVPVIGEDDVPGAVLVGRVPEESLKSLIVGLQGTVGEGRGFIVNENGRIIAHLEPDRLLTYWQPPQTAQRPIRTIRSVEGVAYQGRQENTNARELVYSMTTSARPFWTVVITVPYEVVLRIAFNIAGWLALVSVLVTGLFYANLAFLGRQMTEPIAELVETTQSIAAGGSLTTPINTKRDDEIGQLGQAFAQMQQTLKGRLDELSLLLSVSQEVSTSIDINHSMPVILKGALQGTNSVGARAVVLNPSGGYPLIFGEGPASKKMAVLDRPIMNKLRHLNELTLSSRNQIRQTLEVSNKLPVPALMAIPLHSHDRFQGIVWLGYGQPYQATESERNLLHTLASQSSVLVQNARLFATAEGGRRRLAAVLASTTDAVIVTDQTERVLLINRAMERIFSLQASKVIGRPVADVVQVDSLVEALAGRDERVRNFEIPLQDGRIFYTSASTIIRNDGQVLGRVAVLHDITHFKEIDEMKSDFVATVSHDLRSPLTFMRGYATMLPMVGELNEKQDEYLTKILNGVEQMAKLVDDLLDLGRIEAGVDLKFYNIEVNPLLTDLVNEYDQHARFNGIKIHLKVEPQLPYIQGDKALIRQAITNLVTNGIKYAPNSGDMRVTAARRNGEILISIKDKGPGISKEDQMRLFEKFYRVKQRGTEKVKGSGLGLAIVRSIAEKHGGRVWCDSQVGQGSTFGIALPIPDSE